MRGTLWPPVWRESLPWAGASDAFGRIAEMHSRRYGDGFLVARQVGFSAATSDALFTVTGLVALRIIGYQITLMKDVAEAVSVGTVAQPADLIAATNSDDIRAADLGATWIDGTPAIVQDVDWPGELRLVGAESPTDDIAIIATSTAGVDSGTMMFYCFWKPISPDATVVQT